MGRPIYPGNAPIGPPPAIPPADGMVGVDEIILNISYDRFGAEARPFNHKVGFFYNKPYVSVRHIVMDFYFNGWDLTGIYTENSIYFYRFTRSKTRKIFHQPPP